MIDLVDYSKLCGFQTIKKLAEDNKIDSVYVRYVNENQDMMIDCNKPTHMLHLKDIIASRSPLVVGWRLHHHRRNDKNEQAARKLMEQDENRLLSMVSITICLCLFVNFELFAHILLRAH